MRRCVFREPFVGAIAVILAFASAGPVAQAQESGKICKAGDAMSVLNAFYPSIAAVNRFSFDEDGQWMWTVVRPGGLGHGVAHCQFRLFAAAVPFLADTYEFCIDEVFFGGTAWSIPYSIPDAEVYLDEYYPNVQGSYRNKAMAELSLLREEVTLLRETYLDSLGTERLVGDGGPDDPALIDPSAGDPKPQELVVTAYKDFTNLDGEKIVYRHEGIVGQLEGGTYRVHTKQFFGDQLIADLPPVAVTIIPCDSNP